MANPDKDFQNLATAKIANTIRQMDKKSTSKTKSSKTAEPHRHKRRPVLLTAVCLLTLALGGFLVHRMLSASSNPVTVSASLNGQPMKAGGTYTVRPGDTITVEANSSQGTIETIRYCWGDAVDSEVTEEQAQQITISVPEYDPGHTEVLRTGAAATQRSDDASIVIKTGWNTYTLVYADDIYLKSNGQRMQQSSPAELVPGASIQICSSFSADTLDGILYRWNAEDAYTILNGKSTGDAETITVPMDFEAGKTYSLHVNALLSNGLCLDGKRPGETTAKVYPIHIPNNYVAGKAVRVFVNDVEIQSGSTTAVKAGATIDAKFFPADKVVKTNYKYNDNQAEDEEASSLRKYLPENAKKGEIYTIKLNAYYTDGYFIDNKNEDETVSLIYRFEIVD